MPSPWPRGRLLERLLSETAKRGFSAMKVGSVIAADEGETRSPKTEAQSFYDVEKGTKRLWVNDAEKWAEMLDAQLVLDFEDPWERVLAAISDLPPDDAPDWWKVDQRAPFESARDRARGRPKRAPQRARPA